MNAQPEIETLVEHELPWTERLEQIRAVYRKALAGKEENALKATQAALREMNLVDLRRFAASVMNREWRGEDLYLAKAVALDLPVVKPEMGGQPSNTGRPTTRHKEKIPVLEACKLYAAARTDEQKLAAFVPLQKAVFRLDGELICWGEATVEQLTARERYLQKEIEGIRPELSMLSAVVQSLRRHGAETLAQLLAENPH